MKSFVCIVLLAAAACAAPEGKRDKRGYLSGGLSLGHGLDLGHSSLDLGHSSLDLSHSSLGLGHSSLGLGHSSLGLGHSSLDLGHDLHLGHGLSSLSGLDHGHIYSAPSAKIISINKVVDVPRVVEVKKIVSVPKVVSVPRIVQVNKIVEEPHYSHYAPSLSSGWW